MTSWRDELSAPAQGDLDAMLTTGVRLAQGKLAQASEFEPFALVVDNEGRLLAVDLDLSGLGKHPEADEIALATTAQLLRLAESTRAACLTINTRLSREKTDAIEVRLEHREGVALLLFTPYKRPRFGGVIEYGDTKAYPGNRSIWR